MHVNDGDKPRSSFQEEINALIDGTSVRSLDGAIDFTEFYFPDGMDFSGRVFSQYTVFLRASFAGSANFSRAQFKKDANFARVTFQQVDLSSTTFEENGVFAAAVFRQRAGFGGSVFKKNADFNESRFEGYADFGNAELHSPVFASSAFFGRAWFGSARLCGRADFHAAAFANQVCFSNSHFSGSADFSFARHGGESEFFQVRFESVNFNCSEFSGSADFRKTIFCGESSFHLAKFQDVRFESASFHRGASFDSATFSGSAEFHRAGFGPSPETDNPVDKAIAIADFSDARFEKPTRVWFTQVNKGIGVGLRARFLNCDVEEVNLQDVQWQRRRSGRMVLQDELDIVESSQRKGSGTAGQHRSEYELVAICYRQLINNFDKVRSLDLAEDCFCGSMEMKRRDPHEFLVSRAVLNAYRLASAYGSSYAQALGVLLLIVIAFGLVIAVPCFQLEAAPSESKAVQMASGWLRRGPAGLFHSLEIATFQKDTAYVLLMRRGRIIVIFEQILVPAQVALLLLALRRRFRR